MKNKSLCRTCKNFWKSCNPFPTNTIGAVITSCQDFRRGPVNEMFKKIIDEKESADKKKLEKKSKKNIGWEVGRL